MGKKSEERKCDEMVEQAIVKLVEMIIHARCPAKSSPQTTPEIPRFNLALGNIPWVRQKLSSLSADLHSPLEVHVCTSDGLLLEKWRMQYLSSGFNVEDKYASNMHAYLQFMVFLRSMCATCILLPLGKVQTETSWDCEIVTDLAESVNFVSQNSVDKKSRVFEPIRALTGSFSLSIEYMADYVVRSSVVLPQAPTPMLPAVVSPSQGTETKEEDQALTVKRPQSALTKMLLEHGTLHRSFEDVADSTGSLADAAKEDVNEQPEKVSTAVSDVQNTEGEIVRASSDPRAIPQNRTSTAIVRSTMQETFMISPEEDDFSEFYAFPTSSSVPIKHRMSVPLNPDPGSLPPHLSGFPATGGPWKVKSLSRSVVSRGRMSSSNVSERESELVTLPSGTVYKSPSATSLADMISRGSVTSQYLSTTPTSDAPPFAHERHNSTSSSPLFPEPIRRLPHRRFISASVQQQATSLSSSASTSVGMNNPFTVRRYNTSQEKPFSTSFDKRYSNSLESRRASQDSFAARFRGGQSIPDKFPWVVTVEEKAEALAILNATKITEDDKDDQELDMPFALYQDKDTASNSLPFEHSQDGEEGSSSFASSGFVMPEDADEELQNFYALCSHVPVLPSLALA